jgi:hypothetical protein
MGTTITLLEIVRGDLNLWNPVFVERLWEDNEELRQPSEIKEAVAFLRQQASLGRIPNLFWAQLRPPEQVLREPEETRDFGSECCELSTLRKLDDIRNG